MLTASSHRSPLLLHILAVFLPLIAAANITTAVVPLGETAVTSEPTPANNATALSPFGSQPSDSDVTSSGLDPDSLADSAATQLTELYAENGTWTEEGVVRLVTAIRHAAVGTTALHACPSHDCADQSHAECLSAGQLVSASRNSLASLCPALLHQTQTSGCIEQLGSRPAARQPRLRPRPAEVWGYGLLFVTIISLSSIFAVLLLPMLGRALFERLMPALIGLAVGSLSSSALFHLIPQAFDLVVEGRGHGYLSTALCVLAGAWFFFMIERIMKISLDFKKRQRPSGPTRRLSHEGVLSQLPTADETSSGNGSGDPGCGDGLAQRAAIYTLSMPTDLQTVRQSHQEPVRSMFGQVEQKPHTHHHHEHQIQFEGDGGASTIAVVAWMVIFGDGFHNFLDGLSIGAAFSENILTGISISLAVLCEELPHELGDFAVLLDAGMTVRQAVVYNFLSACTCYVGLVVGVIIGDFTEDTTFVFALAAGMFLYISLVDMMPEMNEAAEKGSGDSVAAGLRVLLLQNMGIMIGCFSLFSLAYFQDSLALN